MPRVVEWAWWLVCSVLVIPSSDCTDMEAWIVRIRKKMAAVHLSVGDLEDSDNLRNCFEVRQHFG